VCSEFRPISSYLVSFIRFPSNNQFCRTPRRLLQFAMRYALGTISHQTATHHHFPPHCHTSPFLTTLLHITTKHHFSPHCYTSQQSTISHHTATHHNKAPFLTTLLHITTKHHFSPDCYTSQHQTLKLTPSIVQNFINNVSAGTSNSAGTCKLPDDGIDDAETCRSK
jgi:hypothetical protein